MYRGRFAPAPSGPLHFGSTLAALASFLQARSNQGKWLIRIEDIDVPRTMPGARDKIMASLETLGLHWDEEITIQSLRLDFYQLALDHLKAMEKIYPCSCSRKQYKGKPYPGTCRKHRSGSKTERALRIRTHDDQIGFTDAVQGRYSQQLESEVGDFIVYRADDIFAYHLAVVVDDAAQGITEIVRGTDILDSTPRQIFLQHTLGYQTPSYCHIPLAVDKHGNKLSKQNHAPSIDSQSPQQVLLDALNFLNQAPDMQLVNYPVEEIICWAIENWSLDKIPKTQEIIVKTDL